MYNRLESSDTLAYEEWIYEGSFGDRLRSWNYRRSDI